MSRFVMAKPKPTPSLATRNSSLVLCSKGSKMRSKSAWGMPAPVSLTAKRKPDPSFHVASHWTCPSVVNLRALARRLFKIWTSHPTSPSKTLGTESATCMVKVLPVASARLANPSATRSNTPRLSNFTALGWAFSEPSRSKSNTSVSNPLRCLPANCM